MDKWFKDILPDKDPYHNRGRDQMRKKGGPEFECLCVLWLSLTFSLAATVIQILIYVNKIYNNHRNALINLEIFHVTKHQEDKDGILF
jgi:hypothetical protein